jgi:acetylornithine deacetylase
LASLEQVVAKAARLFAIKPAVSFPLRWLPSSVIPDGAPLVAELQQCVSQVLGRSPNLEPIEGPCDAFIFHHFGIPAVMWGASGGNTHGADEYVDIESLVQSTAALLLFVCRWCGVR